MKPIRLFIMLMLSGWLFLVAQEHVLPVIDEMSHDGTFPDNLIAVQADPPGKTCADYGNRCAKRGEVICQDSGGEKYPIAGATVAIVQALKRSAIVAGGKVYDTFVTDTNGKWSQKEQLEVPWDGRAVTVQSLPDGKLPTGQLYKNMQGPTSAMKGFFWSGPGIGNNKNAYWESLYTGCSATSTSCESNVQIAVVKESPNILTFTAFYRLPKRTDNVQMTYHSDKDGANVSDSPALSANYLGQAFDEKGEAIHRYTTSWSYTLPDTSDGSSAEYHVTVDTAPPAVPNVQGAQDPPFSQEIPEVFFVSPESLKLGTFSFENVGTGCKELTFRITWTGDNIVTPTPLP